MTVHLLPPTQQLQPRCLAMDWHCLPLISWCVSVLGLIAESVVGWLTEFESEELSARMTTEGPSTTVPLLPPTQQLQPRCLAMDWHCLPLIPWCVSIIGIIAESVVGWLTEFESEELSARMTTEGSTDDGTAPTAHSTVQPRCLAMDWHCLPLIPWCVSVLGLIAESVVGWLTEFESEELSARMTTEGSTDDGTAPTAHSTVQPRCLAMDWHCLPLISWCVSVLGL